MRGRRRARGRHRRRPRLRRAQPADPSRGEPGRPPGRRDTGQPRRVRHPRPRRRRPRGRLRSSNAAPRSSACSPVERADPPLPDHHRPRTSRRTGSSGSRAPGSTASWPRRSAIRTSRTSARSEGQAPSDRRLVVGRVPPSQGRQGVGSLLLGLRRRRRQPAPHRRCSAFTAARRGELVDELAPYEENALDGHPWAEWADAEAHEGGGKRMPGAPSRWNSTKDSRGSRCGPSSSSR